MNADGRNACAQTKFGDVIKSYFSKPVAFRPLASVVKFYRLRVFYADIQRLNFLRLFVSAVRDVPWFDLAIADDQSTEFQL